MCGIGRYIRIEMPEKVRDIIKTIHNNGFEAYVVGGCVRDSILGKEPKDWDITTNALPDYIKRIFPKIIPTGEKHGTITVMVDGEGFEVTTYRVDGRHPDDISFSYILEEDLRHRDFTINAMAYNDEVGIVDLFGGIKDLDNRVIRAVGNPKDRFNEDYLRILRAKRFSILYGFRIDKETRIAMSSVYLDTLKGDIYSAISPERIRDEFVKVLNKDVLTRKDLSGSFILKIIPELKGCRGVEQGNGYHYLDVLNHIMEVVANTENDLVLRLAALLHDIGKPECKSTDDNKVDHFYGHGKRSMEIAEVVLKRLKYSNEIVDSVKQLIEYHEFSPNDPKRTIKKILGKIGYNQTKRLIKLRIADISGQSEISRERLPVVRGYLDILEDIINEGDAVNVKQLVINGNDLMGELGLNPGPVIGKILGSLLDLVISGKLDNCRECLIDEAKKIYTVLVMKG